MGSECPHQGRHAIDIAVKFIADIFECANIHGPHHCGHSSGVIAQPAFIEHFLRLGRPRKFGGKELEFVGRGVTAIGGQSGQHIKIAIRGRGHKFRKIRRVG